MESPKPDCAETCQRKMLRSSSAKMSRTLSLVRFAGNNLEIAPFSRKFQRNPGGFLCTSDCVGEREGFSPCHDSNRLTLILKELSIPACNFASVIGIPYSHAR